MNITAQVIQNLFYKYALLLLIATSVSIGAIYISYTNDLILSYGDSESHINISKRVIDSITPGFAQLGGIWLPIPHLLMVPLVKIDFLWRSGLAGAIVSGFLFVIASIYIYKLTFLVTGKKTPSIVAFLVFILNPNLLYLQSTPMSEVPFISFCVISIYYFVSFLKTDFAIYLSVAAFFGFCATLSRYDGWLLVLAEAALIVVSYLLKKKSWRKLEGAFILFSTPAFIGILFWLAWGFIILGNPLYFTDSPFSAKSQQQSWLARGELPAYHNLDQAFYYYFVDSLLNTGIYLFPASLLGLILFLYHYRYNTLFFTAGLLAIPFIFNVLTLYIGQSVLFLPEITPGEFEWKLFNARYGVLMVPFVAFFIGFLYYKLFALLKILIISLIIVQCGSFVLGFERIISVDDGVFGLSAAKRPDAEVWMAREYDYGLVLLDDYTRSISIIRSNLPMEKVIYIGNKPYWEESLSTPEKHARWIVIQQGDSIYKRLIENKEMEGQLYTYFNRTYTSPEIQIFRRIDAN